MICILSNKGCSLGTQFVTSSKGDRLTATMKMLTYGVATNFLDDSLRIGKSTAIERVKKVC